MAVTSNPVAATPLNGKTTVTPAAPASQDQGAAPKPLPVNAHVSAPQTFGDVFRASRAATAPAMGTLLPSALRSGASWTNVLWTGASSLFSNAVAWADDRQSGARVAGNIVTDVTFSVGKGIVSSFAVQGTLGLLAPALGALPAPLGLVTGVVVGFATAMGVFAGLDAVLKRIGIGQKMADGLTQVFGGDLKPGLRS